MLPMSTKQAKSSSLELEQLTTKDANGHTPLVVALRNVSEPPNLALQPTAHHWIYHSASCISRITSDPPSAIAADQRWSGSHVSPS